MPSENGPGTCHATLIGAEWHDMSALLPQRPWGKGSAPATDVDPSEIQAARRFALDNTLEIAERLMQIVRSPERGDQHSILAARELLALAQGLKQSSVEGALSNARVLVIDVSKLDTEAVARLRSAG